MSVWRVVSIILTVLSFSLVAVSVIFAPKKEVTLFEQKKDEADTLLLYEIKRGESIKFNVLPGHDLHYIISHLLLPADHEYDPNEKIEYSMKMRFVDKQGKTVHEHAFWEVSRQSKAIEEEGGWVLENAFLPKDEGQLTDETFTVLRVGELLPQGGEVSIRAEKSPYPVLLRIYRIEPRADLERLKRISLLADFKKKTIASYMGFESLEELSMADLWMLFQRKWQRVEAADEAGEPPAKRRIYYHGFRLPRLPLDDTIIEIPPGRKEAINLAGPDVVHLLQLEPKSATRLNVTKIPSNLDEGAGAIEKQIILRQDIQLGIEIENEAETLIFENVGKSTGKYKLAYKNEPTANIGNTIFMPDTTMRWNSFVIAERPKIKNFTLFSGSDYPLEFSTLGLAGKGLMRLEIRALLDEKGDTQTRTVKIYYYSWGKKPIREYTVSLSPVASPFEKMIVNNEEVSTWISEPQAVFLNFPRKVVKIKMESETALLVRAFVEKPEEIIEDIIYPEIADSLRWRYRKAKYPIWYPIQANHWRELEANGRVPQIVTQTRMEVKELNIEEANFWSTLTHLGEQKPESLYEEIIEQEGEENIITNPLGYRLECEKERDVECTVGIEPGSTKLGVLDLSYYVPKKLDLDGLISFSQNGKTIANIRPTTRKDYKRVRKIRKKGTLRWQHNFDGGDPRVFFKTTLEQGVRYVPPKNCKLYKTFSVVKISPREARTFSFNQSVEDPGPINIVAYSKTLPKLHTTLDRGKTKRKFGPALKKYTRATKTLESEWKEIQPDIWLSSNPEIKLQTTKTSFFGVGNDLQKGRHLISVRNNGKDPVWIRAFQRSSKSDVDVGVTIKSL